jgi:hypothetical protein
MLAIEWGPDPSGQAALRLHEVVQCVAADERVTHWQVKGDLDVIGFLHPQ